eukprot:gi/632966281/ref/XP_007899327.1/ PREDICTED: alkaline ceramidase 1-like [Callorhinchus milii]
MRYVYPGEEYFYQLHIPFPPNPIHSNPKNGSLGVFAVQSSEIDWCENKFQYSENVAEFYDTISNSSFFISAPITMYLAHPYAREKSGAVHLVWIMLMLIGFFSTYYRMTLSYFGQPPLDEISILVLSVVKPTVNTYVLNSVVLHVLYLVVLETERHALMNVAIVHAATLFAYFDALSEIQDIKTEVKYWPVNSGCVGISCLALQSKAQLLKSC